MSFRGRMRRPLADKLREPEIQSRANAQMCAVDYGQRDEFDRLVSNHVVRDYFSGRAHIQFAARQAPSGCGDQARAMRSRLAVSRHDLAV